MYRYSKHLELEDGVPVFRVDAPLCHREDDVRKYAAREVLRSGYEADSAYRTHDDKAL